MNTSKTLENEKKDYPGSVYTNKTALILHSEYWNPVGLEYNTMWGNTIRCEGKEGTKICKILKNSKLKNSNDQPPIGASWWCKIWVQMWTMREQIMQSMRARYPIRDNKTCELKGYKFNRDPSLQIKVYNNTRSRKDYKHQPRGNEKHSFWNREIC